jgi:hypothetical protein
LSNALGADFSGVKVHTGQNAVEMNRSLNARAFTHGNDIYFNKGEYNPESSEGKRLLAHELTHVVQQKGVNEVDRKSVNSEKNTLADGFRLKTSNVPDVQKDGGLTVGIIGLLVSVGAFAVGQGGGNPLTVDPRLQRIATANTERETYRSSHPFRNKSWSFFNGSWPKWPLDREWDVSLRWQYNGSELTDVHLTQGYRQFTPFDNTHAKLIMVDNQASNKRIGFRCEFVWDPAGAGHGVYQCEGWISADGTESRTPWRWHDY